MRSIRRVENARRRDRSVVLFGKVDVVGDQRFESDQLVAQREHAATQSAVELSERHALRRARRRAHEIARRLGLKNVELAVQHRASREFARPRHARAARDERADDRRRHDEPPCVMISTASSPVNDAGAS